MPRTCRRTSSWRQSSTLCCQKAPRRPRTRLRLSYQKDPCRPRTMSRSRTGLPPKTNGAFCTGTTGTTAIRRLLRVRRLRTPARRLRDIRLSIRRTRPHLARLSPPRERQPRGPLRTPHLRLHRTPHCLPPKSEPPAQPTSALFQDSMNPAIGSMWRSNPASTRLRNRIGIS